MNIIDRIIVDDIAKNDLLQIYNYIYFKLQNQIAAKNTIEGIKSKILSLKQLSTRGKFFQQEKSNIRYIPFKNYLIFYEFQEKENLIIIKRIIYKKRNLGKFL